MCNATKEDTHARIVPSNLSAYIEDVMDVVVDGHYGYRCIIALLGMGEESWPLIRHDLYKELSQWRDEYATLVGSHDRLEELKKSLLVHSPSGV